MGDRALRLEMARSCFRLAVVAGDETTVGRIRGRLSFGPGWVSYTLQDAVADLWIDRATGHGAGQGPSSPTGMTAMPSGRQ